MNKSVFGDDSDDDDEVVADQQEEPASALEPAAKQKPDRPKRPHSETKPKVADDTAGESSKRSKMSDDKGEDEEVWLYRGILVRIINKKLAKYFRCKATVDKVDGYTAEVTVLVDNGDDVAGDVLRLDQDDLETVSPKQVGQRVRILRGKYRGKKAVAVQLDKKKYRAILELKDGSRLEKVDYDDFSKLA